MLIDPLSPNESKYDKQEIIKFWDYMESLLEPNPSQLEFKTSSNTIDENVANSCLVNFLKVSTDKYKEYINTDKDIYRISLMLTESQIFENHKDFCISKLLSLLNIDLLELNMKFIISYVLLFETKKDLNSIEIILKYQGFTVIYNTLYTQFAYLSKYDENSDIYGSNPTMGKELTDIDISIIDEMKQISTVLMDIMFQIFKFCKCSIANVQLVDHFFVHFLITAIRSDTLDDLFNNAEFKLLLALNEQYMMFNKDYSIENKVLKYLIDDSVNKNFTELLLLKFNRTKDATLQIMMSKILYLILSNTSRKIAGSFFYLNDLNVFVDVLLRELQDISDKDEVLRNTFLRVLIPLLKNTDLTKTHYRKEDLIRLLKYLCVFDNICSDDNILPEHKTTVKLAFKCLNEVPWLAEEQHLGDDINVENSGTVSQPHSRASSITAMAMSFSRERTNNSKVSLASSSISNGSVGSNIDTTITKNQNPSYNTSSPRKPLSRGSSDTQFYRLPSDVSAESLLSRKNKPVPPPPPPPSRKTYGVPVNVVNTSSHNSNGNTNQVGSHLMGVRQ